MITINEYRRVVKKIIVITVLSFGFLISGYKWILPYIAGFWALSIILEFNFTKRYRQSVNDKNYILLLLQIIFFGIISAGYFYSDNKSESVNDIIQKLGLLLFPLVFVFSGNILKKHKNSLLFLFIISNILYSIICLFYALYTSTEFTGNQIIFNPISETGHRFYYTHLSVFQHPSYFALYIIFALASMFYLKDTEFFKKSVLNLIIYYSGLVFFSIMIFLLSSRAGIITGLMLACFRLIQNVLRYRRLFFKIAVLLLFFTAVAVVFKNPRINAKISETGSFGLAESAQKSTLSRLIFWETAVSVISNNFWIGTGNGDSQSLLDAEYKNNEFAKAKFIGYNVHNQFLEIFMSSGFIGFFVLLSIFIFAVYKALKENRQLFLIFLFAVGFNFLFESMLNTLAGVFFFSFFFNYFVFVQD